MTAVVCSRIGLFCVDKVGDVEMVGIVGFWERRIAGVGDQDFEPRRFEPRRRLGEHVLGSWEDDLIDHHHISFDPTLLCPRPS